MGRSSFLRSLVSAAVLAACSMVSNAALGVTAPQVIKDVERVETVTTGAAVRARADVQIRRIKSLIVSKNSDDEADYEKLEKLQKDLRGER